MYCYGFNLNIMVVLVQFNIGYEVCNSVLERVDSVIARIVLTKKYVNVSMIFDI